jgi:hypothetical protein
MQCPFVQLINGDMSETWQENEQWDKSISPSLRIFGALVRKQALDHADCDEAHHDSNYTMTDLFSNGYSSRRYIDGVLYVQWNKGDSMSYADI